MTTQTNASRSQSIAQVLMASCLGVMAVAVFLNVAVSYTHLTLPTICSV